MEYLEEFRSQMMEHTPICPPLETVDEKTKPGTSQPPSESGKMETESVKPLYFQPSDFKRELKIIGQIGEPGQKDKLSFVSLVRQIEGALKKRYTSVEVVDAVVRAINPGMRLRRYLEGLDDLTRPRLRRILRSHYQEKSATELYRQLSTLVQEPQESPQNFLIRALDTRQKILFASQELDTQLKYDPKLVQEMFLRAVDTGLQDEAIRSRLRPSLQTPEVQDEDLIQQMNVVVSEETGRKSKLGTSNRHKSAKVNEVHVSQVEGSAQLGISERKSKTPEKDSLKEDKFMAALQAVRTELATLKESVEKNRAREEQFVGASSGYQNQQWYQRPKGCPNWQAAERGESCDHFHVCSSSDHWACGCRKRNGSSEKVGPGNRRGLQPRDRK